MTTRRSNVTSSGVIGPPEGGVSRCIVPAPGMSSSYHGQGIFDESGVDDADRREMRSPSPVRLLGGGGGWDSNEEGKGESGGEAHQGSATPSTSEGMETGHRARSKSRSTARRGAKGGSGKWAKDRISDQGKGSETGAREESPHGQSQTGGETHDDSGSPVIETGAGGLKKDGTGSRWSSPCPSEVSTECMDTSPSYSPAGTKRVREKGEEGGMGEPGGSRGSRTSSAEGVKKRRQDGSVEKRRQDGSVERRGRHAKNPENEGQFTWYKIAESKKDAKDKRMEETAKFIADPECKAKTKRAGSAERNALKLTGDLRDAPTASITQMGVDAVEQIKKVAATSSNLKGTYVGILWKAAEDLTALNMVLTRRAQEAKDEDGERRASELEEMRREISALRTSEALLQGQVRALREAVALGERERTVPPRMEEPLGKRGKMRANAAP